VNVGNLPGCHVVEGAGAFVNAFAPATTAAEYQLAISAGLAALQLFAIDFEAVEPLSTRVRRQGVLDDELMELVDEAEREDRARFATFHYYPHADA
jgi:hypothetical protein